MNRFFKLFYLFAVYIFLYTPIAVLVVYSFNSAKFSALWQGGTLDWYRQLFKNHDLLIIAANSLIVSGLAAIFSTLIGSLGAIALFRYRFLGRRLLNALVFILILVPDLVIGISLLVLFALCDIQLGFLTLLLAHITFCIPFVVVIAYGRLRDMDTNIFEAARDLGANEFLIFKKIILPLMMPALIASVLLSFTLSMDDVVISFFVSGPSFQILPLYIFSQVKVGTSPEISALCSLVMGLTVVLVFIAQIVMRKKP